MYELEDGITLHSYILSHDENIQMTKTSQLICAWSRCCCSAHLITDVDTNAALSPIHGCHWRGIKAASYMSAATYERGSWMEESRQCLAVVPVLANLSRDAWDERCSRCEVCDAW